jgi:hypothetical protein
MREKLQKFVHEVFLDCKLWLNLGGQAQCVSDMEFDVSEGAYIATSKAYMLYALCLDIQCDYKEILNVNIHA